MEAEMNRRSFLKFLPVLPLAAAAMPLKNDQEQELVGKYVVRYPEDFSPEVICRLREAVYKWQKDIDTGAVIALPEGVELFRA